MPASSCAAPTCSNRPSASTTATPVLFFSPQARSSPTKCMTPLCLMDAPLSCVFVTIPNVLANRYASAEMVAIWSPEAKIVAERRLWLAVLRAQAELGGAVPAEAVTDYERGLQARAPAPL